MSTIKSSSEHLTLNADGSGKEIKFQCNGTEVAKIDSTGFVGAGSPSIDDNGTATAITIDSNGKVGVGTGSPLRNLHISDTTNGATTGIRLTGANNGSQVIEFADTDDGNVGYIQYNHGSNRMSLRTGDANSLNIDSDGIKFGTDTASANALDDYEEGTWTPTFYIGGTNNTQTTLFGNYTKIGRIVYMSGNIYINSTISGTGNLYIYGLPFNASSVDSCRGFSFQCNDKMDMGEAVMYIGASGNRIEIVKLPDSINDNMRGMTHSDLHSTAGGKYISFSIWYFA